MNRDEVIRMAREAGFLGPGDGGDPDGIWEPTGMENVTEYIHRFAALIRAATIEECAGICDRFAARDMHPAECAGAIRALKGE